ncbi:unnamed protein product, partial [Closterium sp. Yama58-4]
SPLYWVHGAVSAYLVLRSNFFIAAVNAHIRYTVTTLLTIPPSTVTTDLPSDAAAQITRYIDIFNIVLAAGGVFAVPLAGWSMERPGLPFSFALTTLLCALCSAVQMMASWVPLPMQLVAFLAFAIARAFIYSTMAAYVGTLFGFRNFGRLYGINRLGGAFLTLLQYPLMSACESSMGAQFLLVNGIIYGYSGILPVLVLEVGAFSDACGAGEAVPCAAQMNLLNAAYTLTPTLMHSISIMRFSGICANFCTPVPRPPGMVTNSACVLPVGAFLDAYGPRTTAITGSLVFSAGLLALALGSASSLPPSPALPPALHVSSPSASLLPMPPAFPAYESHHTLPPLLLRPLPPPWPLHYCPSRFEQSENRSQPITGRHMEGHSPGMAWDGDDMAAGGEGAKGEAEGLKGMTEGLGWMAGGRRGAKKGMGVAGVCFFAAFFLLALGGPFIITPMINFSELLPSSAAAVIAAQSGAFDASAAVLFLFALAVSRLHLALSAVCLAYLAVPLAITAIAAATFPDVCDESSLKRGSTPCLPPPPAIYNADIATQLRSQLFWVHVGVAAFYVLRSNVYIAAVNDQISFAVHAKAIIPPSATAAVQQHYIDAFNCILPLGGCLSVPLAGWSIDSLGLPPAFAITAALSLLSSLLLLLAHCLPLDAMLLSFAAYSVARAFIYSTMAALIASLFGFRNFGRLYGLTRFIGAFAVLLQYPLMRYGEETMNGDFTGMTAGFMVCELALATLFPLYLTHCLFGFFWRPKP